MLRCSLFAAGEVIPAIDRQTELAKAGAAEVYQALPLYGRSLREGASIYLSEKNNKNYEEIAWRSLFRCKIIGEKNELDFNPIQWDDWWARNAKNFESPIAYENVIKVFYDGIRPKFPPIENGIDIDF